MSGYILFTAFIILVCLLLKKVSNKIGIPMLLAFILLGMLFGSDGLVKVSYDNYNLSEQICTVSLVFIMFYGGFGTNWSKAKPIAVKAVLLSTVGVILTALITGIFCVYVLHFNFWEGMLIGAVISSTDAASVFSILRSKKLNLRDNTASILEVESGSNDPCSYMLTVIILSVMNGKQSGVTIIYMVFAQIAYGIIVGVLVAFLSRFILKKIKFTTDGFDTIFVFSMALFAYAGAAVIGGNGYLSVYIAGICLGNAEIESKQSLVHFFDGITGLMQMLIFFLLGLLSFPSQFPGIIPAALGIALFLTLIARPLVTFIILAPLGSKLNQILLVAWSGLRGAASIVFAIMVTVDPAYTKHDIFHIVFFIVLISICIQGSLIPKVSRKLNMIDDDSDVMKTFSDYSDEMPIQFIQFGVYETHPWNNRMVKDITILPEILLVLIIRGEENIIPNGDTLIMAGDMIILSALSVESEYEVHLKEILIEKENVWLGMSLEEIKLGDRKLVIIVKRNGYAIIPNGKTVIEENDMLVICQAQ